MGGRFCPIDKHLRDVLLIAALALAGCFLVARLEAQTTLPDAPSTRSANRAFWIVTGIDYAASFADAAVSVHSHFQPGPGHCHETHAQYGAPFPSNARLYGQMAAETTALAVGMWFLKRHHHDWFVLAPLIHATIHTVATINTADACL